MAPPPRQQYPSPEPKKRAAVLAAMGLFVTDLVWKTFERVAAHHPIGRR